MEEARWLGYEDGENGSSTAERLRSELLLSADKCEALEHENSELRVSLRKSISTSALGREFEALSVDREKMSRAIDQLKVEKSHLVESVLLLSTEVDEANRLRQDDQLKFKQEVLRHAENEKAIRSGKYRMGMQVVELLKIRGIDVPICHEVSNYVANTCAATASAGGGAGGGGGPGLYSNYSGGRGPFSSRGEVDSPTYAASASFDENDNELGGGNCDGNSSSPTNVSDGRSNNYSHSGRRRRNHRRRRSEILDRDETDSIISSVSTHRSGLSTSAAAAKNGSSSSSNRSNGGGRKSRTPITAEALALLDRQNTTGFAALGGGDAGRIERAVDNRAPPQWSNWWGF